MSNLLNKKHAFAKLRVELEGRRGKLCQCCKGLGHLAQNYRNGKEKEKGAAIPQNKFEVLSTRVMQCGMEERMIRSIGIAVRCFKCREEGCKCRECPLWQKQVRVAHPVGGKAHQQEERKPAHLKRGKAQEHGKKRELRRVEEEKAACSIGGKAQQAYRRASVERLRKRTEEHCGKEVPKEAWLFDLGWMTEKVVVSYLVCVRCREQGCYGVISRRRLEQLNWCRCQKKKEEGAAWLQEAKAQQSSAQPGGPEGAAKERGSQREVRRTFAMLREV